jgi:hypothetical protein
MQSFTSFNPMMSYQVDLMTDADDAKEVTSDFALPEPPGLPPYVCMRSQTHTSTLPGNANGIIAMQY